MIKKFFWIATAIVIATLAAVPASHEYRNSRSVPETVKVFFLAGSFLFKSHPTFSRQYLLRGHDEEAIRKLFTDDVIWKSPVDEFFGRFRCCESCSSLWHWS
ncbi:MAG: hypothetical protein ACKV2Q_02770 [Planctomycetaceae bacterium]